MLCLIFPSLVSHLFAQKEALAFIPVFEKSFKFLESGRKRRPIELFFQLFLHLRKTKRRLSIKLISGKLEKVNKTHGIVQGTKLRNTCRSSLYTDDPSMGRLHLRPGVLPMMAYTGRLRPKRVPLSGFRFLKEELFH